MRLEERNIRTKFSLRSASNASISMLFSCHFCLYFEVRINGEMKNPRDFWDFATNDLAVYAPN
jgi:hypothetical protein